MMNEKDREQGLAIAKRELSEIERKMSELVQRKAAVLAFVQVLKGEPETDLREHVSTLVVHKPEAVSDRPGSLARQSNKQIVSLAIEIIRAKGVPMTAPEIHLLHPLRDEVDVPTLYRLLYNRVVSRHLSNLDGAFWPITQSLPTGWQSPRASGKGRPGRRPKAK